MADSLDDDSMLFQIGDGTNLVIMLAGEFLRKAGDLLRMGLKASDIVQGYEQAQNFVLGALEGWPKPEGSNGEGREPLYG